jgi:hypothetical protein
VPGRLVVETVNITLDSRDGVETSAVIERSDDGPLRLSVIARTTGFYIHISAYGDDGLGIHTTIEFADRLAKTLRREVNAWRKRAARTPASA